MTAWLRQTFSYSILILHHIFFIASSPGTAEPASSWGLALGKWKWYRKEQPSSANNRYKNILHKWEHLEVTQSSSKENSMCFGNFSFLPSTSQHPEIKNPFKLDRELQQEGWGCKLILKVCIWTHQGSKSFDTYIVFSCCHSFMFKTHWCGSLRPKCC